MIFFKIFILLYGLFGEKLTYCVQALEGEAIVGGEEADLGQFPYQVSIRVVNTHRCGGAIIDETHVITAAHCAAIPRLGWTDDPMNIVAGVKDLHNLKYIGSVRVNVEKVYVPEEFFSGQNNRTFTQADIAILKLEESLDFKRNSHLRTVKLAKGADTFADVSAVVTGFGWSEVETHWNGEDNISDEGKSNGELRFANTKVINPKSCQARYKKKITNSHICARVVQHDPDLPEGVCTGDSGGPLVYNDTVIGVVSTSPIGCTEVIKPGIYTRVSSYSDFITKALQDIPDSKIRTTRLAIIDTDRLDQSVSFNLDDY